MKRDIVLEQVYAFPPERVWRALTDPEAMAQWLMTNDFQPRLGHKFQFRAKPVPGWNGIVDCEVITLEEPSKLAYTWKSGGNNTVVTWTLEPVAGGTRLQIAHTGFRGAGGVAVSYMLGSGWKKMLEGWLPQVLALITDQGLAPAAADLPQRDCEHDH